MPDVSNCTVVTNNGYIQGSTCIIHFTFSGIEYTGEWGDSISITYPEGIVPTGYASNPFTLSNHGQDAEILNGIEGRTISWGDNDNTFGGIENGEHLFYVEVEVDIAISGTQTATFFISGDEYDVGTHEITADFEIPQLSVCDPPTSLSATTIDEHTAKLDWDYGCTRTCNLEWGEKGFQTGTGTIIHNVSKPVTLIDLDPGIVYDFYVQDSSSATLIGDWQGPISFSTLFTMLDISLPSYTYGFYSWGDFDCDGKLDILFLGETESCIYRNDGNDTFSEVVLGIPNLGGGSASIADYDNDGDIDFVYSGSDGGDPITELYRNDGALNFTNVNAGLIGLESSAFDWGDVNNDGRPDLLMGGLNQEKEEVSMIYLNRGNEIFELSDIQIKGCEAGSMTFIDYNNDNYADILRTGFDNIGNIATVLYKNNGDLSFEDIRSGFDPAVYYSSCWEDLNNDMYMDLLLCGYTSDSGSVTKIYYNNGDGSFNDSLTSLASLSIRGIGAADLNNDGNSDIYLNGKISDRWETIVFMNDGDGSYNDIHASIIPNAYATPDAGDYDNDGDLDLLITGHLEATRIYKNNYEIPNHAPTAPDGLKHKDIAFGSKLWWNSSDDQETPSSALSYNIKIGSSADSFNIMSPAADTTNGYHRLSRIGNGWLDTSYIVQNLDTGMYYWGVQAIDNGLLTSEFSAIDSFYVMEYFTDIQNGMDSISNMDWGDYDNDGDLDIVTSGRGAYYMNASKIYRNDNGTAFTDVGVSLDSISGIIKWGD
ncbi:MAG: VCBS repeat-containing protein, partial [Bacteroidales bacterium]|nr:VCBS repeat-containing protein [Bacteroidales bacterium]